MPTTKARALFICGIGNLAIARNAPGPDRVVVVEVIFAANGDQFRQRGLHVPGLVRGAALNDRRLTIPVPGQAEARERARQDRLLKLCFLPALAGVDGNVDTPDLAASAPGD